MKRRVLFLALAAGFVVLGLAAQDARAGYVPLPTTINALTPTGNYTTVVGAETLTFSNWTYTSSSVPTGSAPPATSITVNPFTFSNETGFTLNGTLSAPPMTMVDLTISYLVSAPAGESLNDAILLTTGGPLLGGTGTYLVTESLVNPVFPFNTIATLSATNASPSDSATFGNISSLLVTKDIFILGGSTGVSLSAITQAFSSTGVPEPTSLALLGIGMTGFLAFRRFFKKTSAA